jgi:hypothetical protein
MSDRSSTAAESLTFSPADEHLARRLLAEPANAAEVLLLRASLRKVLAAVDGYRTALTTLVSIPAVEAATREDGVRLTQDAVESTLGATPGGIGGQSLPDAIPYVFTEADVAEESEWARRILQATWGIPVGLVAERAMLNAADRHRRRGLAIARLIEQEAQRNGWVDCKYLFPDLPGRLARFVGGPLDGTDRAIADDPPFPLWVAHREKADALEAATFVSPVGVPSIDLAVRPAPPAGGSVIGAYLWRADADHYHWVEVGSEVRT